jgi:hypothetical protein
MRTIAELNMLLRARIELPEGMKLATEQFREGWNFVRTGDAPRLKMKIQARGWNFIKIADGSLRSGVGDTSQQAISSALKLALRRVNEHFNAVEVEHIELTQYPWFFLARVRIYPYRIQQGAVMCALYEALPEPMALRHGQLAPQAADLFPHFGSAIPLLKQMLVSSINSQARSQ